MKLKLSNTIFLVLLFILSIGSQKMRGQCLQIESILVDACGLDEGLNEMVRFKVGSTALNTSNMSVEWAVAAVNWQGVIKNATTASKVAALNADIVAAGGCGQLLEPTNGVLPANATVIIATSFNLDTALNSFGALTETIYIIFQNNANVTTGHFTNHGVGMRTLKIKFGSSCTDTVTYNRALLTTPAGENAAADGATVLFTPAGVATYVNYGCSAPVDPFSVDAGPISLTACAGTTIALAGSALGQQSVLWSASSGSFSANTNLITDYTIPNSAGGQTIVITLTATNSCGAVVTDTINIIVTTNLTPTFNLSSTLCTGSNAPILPTTSSNGITGSWNPSTISNTISGSYVFTPNAGQCATSFTLIVTVGNSITPTFSIANTICAGSTPPILPVNSSNGIAGTWNPTTINNTSSGNYVFTPTTGQCATPYTLNVTVTSSISPTFSIVNTICAGSAAPLLPTTSSNGIVGTWNPSTIDNTTNGNYVFTPNIGQCASEFSIEITITNFEVEFVQSCKIGEFIVTVLPINNSFDAENVTYLWKDKLGNVVGMNENILNISQLMNDTTVFPATYQVTVSNNQGCSITSDVIVYGAFCKIPKGISPNSDGENDFFDLTGLGVDEIYIYNRYGTEVYYKKNYTNEWNGKSDKGHELPAATYFYMIRKKNNEKLTGWVYIIR